MEAGQQRGKQCLAGFVSRELYLSSGEEFLVDAMKRLLPISFDCHEHPRRDCRRDAQLGEAASTKFEQLIVDVPARIRAADRGEFEAGRFKKVGARTSAAKCSKALLHLFPS
jgi:hypothetical protein